MLSENNKKILLNQLHKNIQTDAVRYLEAIRNKTLKKYIHYPPGTKLSTSEIDSLNRALINNSTLESALGKLLKGAIGSAFFDFFNYVDGTGDPGNPAWKGVLLIDKTKEFEFDSRLHDEFFETVDRKD